jgi:hypothetical protein
MKQLKWNSITSKDKVLVYAAYAKNAYPEQLHVESIKTYQSWGYKVIACYNTDSPEEWAGESGDCILVRDNIGYDFGAYTEICTKYRKELNKAESVTFLNESVAPIGNDPSYINSLERYHKDVMFPVSSMEISPHCQSWFIAISRSGLAKGALEVLSEFEIEADQQKIIREMEIPLNSIFKRKGITTGVLWELPLTVVAEGAAGNIEVPSNASLHYWNELLEKGCPFLKLKAPRLGFATGEAYEKRVPSKWRELWER